MAKARFPGSDSFPKKNLWIIACANGGNIKNATAFRPLAKMLLSNMAAGDDTSNMFLFIPQVPQLFDAVSTLPDSLMRAASVSGPADANLFQQKLADLYAAAPREKLSPSLGLIFPHAVCRQVFMSLAGGSLPPCYFDTVRTFIYSSQDNIYLESNTRTQQLIQKSGEEQKKALGDWYRLISNPDEDLYLRKRKTQKLAGLYTKMSQIVATALPRSLADAAFKSYIKTNTTILHERDSVHVTIRLGSAIDRFPLTDLNYAWNSKFPQYTAAKDSILFAGSHTVPDSIVILAGFIITDPLLGKKILHRKYTMAFPPKSTLRDSFLVYRMRWLLILAICIALIFTAIWYRRREMQLNIYRASLSGIFPDTHDATQRLPNKIQIFVIRYSNYAAPYYLLQAGHRRNVLRLFIFDDQCCYAMSRYPVRRQHPFFTAGSTPAEPVVITSLRTTILRLAKKAGSAPFNWLEIMDRCAGNPVIINLDEQSGTTPLYAGVKLCSELYFSRERPLPVLPAYYAAKLAVVQLATDTINQLIRNSQSLPEGNYHLILCLAPAQIGFMGVGIGENAIVSLKLLAVIDARETPGKTVEDLAQGFLAQGPHAGILVAGNSFTFSTAVFFEGGRQHKTAATITGLIMEAIREKRLAGLDLHQHLKTEPGVVFPYHFTAELAGSRPVFEWQAARFPLLLVASRDIVVKTFTKHWQLPDTGTIRTHIKVRRKIRQAIYLAPSPDPQYLQHINPVEKFYFNKNVPVSLELLLNENQLLINGQSYDIKI